MIWALHAEWTKLRTLQSTAWLMVLAIAGTVGLGAAITGSQQASHCGMPCDLDPTKLTLAGVRLGQIGILVLAVLTVTAEYSTRTVQPTLMSVPRRPLVVVGKVGVLSALGLAAGVAAVAGSLTLSRIILPHNGFSALSLADALTRRAAIGTILYIGLIALLGAGLGLLVRDTAGALVAGFALLYGSPVLAMFINDPIWQHRLHRYAPMDAGLVIQSTQNLAAEAIGPWSGLGVLALYAAGAVLAGLAVFHFRDVR